MTRGAGEMSDDGTLQIYEKSKTKSKDLLGETGGTAKINQSTLQSLKLLGQRVPFGPRSFQPLLQNVFVCLPLKALLKQDGFM